MKRVYYILNENNKYYILICASYGFSDDEELVSSSEDIVCEKEFNLTIGNYVVFKEEKIIKEDDKYIVRGLPTMYKNSLSEEDKEEYDKEFKLSIDAYKNNDQEGIDRWQKYLKSYEDKFFDFKEVTYE